MTGPRLGVAYFGNRYTDHARQDLHEIVATGASIVNHVMSEADLRWSPSTMADVLSIGKLLGLENWVAPWGLGGVFGGEAPSYAVMEAPDQCQRDNEGNHLPALCPNQPAFKRLMTTWLNAAAAVKADVVTWDELHLALPVPLSWGDRWSCRCVHCQQLFMEKFGRSMPVSWDDDVASFCRWTVGRALDFLIEAAADRSLSSAVFSLPQEPHNDSTWRQIAGSHDVRYFGVTPYWLLEDLPKDEVEGYLRRWCRRVVAATNGQNSRSLAWIQAFSVPNGREPEIAFALEMMLEEGIDVVCVWAYRACEPMSALAPDNPALVWDTVRRGFASCRARTQFEQ